MAKGEPDVIKHFKSSGLEIIYTLFLALLIALFFGLGVSAFYPAPKSPEYPVSMSQPVKDTSGIQTDEQVAAQTKYDNEQKNYTKEFSVYNRNVSVITLGLAVVALVVSLLLFNNIYVISNGLLLGGVFTLVYSIVRGFMADDSKYRFAIVTVGLLITLVLGYIKFLKPEKEVK